MEAPSGTMIIYATRPGKTAKDGKWAKNSPFTGHLVKQIKTPGLEVGKMIRAVANDVEKETGGKQTPWMEGILKGEFYFNPGSSHLARKRVSSYDPESEMWELVRGSEYTGDLYAFIKAYPDGKYAPAALLKIKQLERLAKKKVVAGKTNRPVLASGPKKTAGNGRYIAYNNGTVLDTKTGLMWAAKDNGEDINWRDAKKYCESYRGGGYTDWRMPTLDELEGLYDENSTYTVSCYSGYDVYLTELIKLSCWCPWASDTKSGSSAGVFNFNFGLRYWDLRSNSDVDRALPVRPGN